MTTRDLLTLAEASAESFAQQADVPDCPADFLIEIDPAPGARGTVFRCGDVSLALADDGVTVTRGGCDSIAPRTPGSTVGLASHAGRVFLAVAGYAMEVVEANGATEASDSAPGDCAWLPDFEGTLTRVRLAALDGPPEAGDFAYCSTTLARQLFDEQFDGDEALFEGPEAVLEIACDDLSENVIVEATVELLPSRTGKFSLIDIAGAGSLEYQGGELHLISAESSREEVLDWTAESIPPYHPGRVYNLALHVQRHADQQTLELFVEGMPCGSVTSPRPAAPAEALITLGGTRHSDPLAREFQFACERLRAVAYAWDARDDLYALRRPYRAVTLLDEACTGTGSEFEVPAEHGGITAPLLAEIEISNALLNTPDAELLSLGGGISVRVPRPGALELVLTAAEGLESGDESRVFEYAERDSDGTTRVSLYAIHAHVASVRVALDGAELAAVVTNLPIAYRSQRVSFAPGQAAGVRARYLSAGGNVTARSTL